MKKQWALRPDDDLFTFLAGKPSSCCEIKAFIFPVMDRSNSKADIIFSEVTMRHLALMAGIAVGFGWACVPAFAEEIKISGGGAAISAVFEPCRKAFTEESGIQVKIKTTTPVKGLAALVQGQVDIAAAAVPFDLILEDAAAEGLRIDPETVQVTELAENSFFVYVNRTNPVTTMSKEQLKAVFTGKITNWKELGGPDLPVVVLWGKATPGQNHFFNHQILDQESVTDKAVPAGDYENIREKIVATPGAIGINPEGLTSSTLKTLVTPKVSAPIIGITKKNPPAAVQRFFSFIKGVFQDLN